MKIFTLFSIQTTKGIFMKKIALSVLLCSSLSCFAQNESLSPEKEIEKLVSVGIKVVQNAEVQEAIVQLHQAYLHFLEVVLQNIASKFGPEEKALAQAGLNYLAELAKDPVLQLVVSKGNPAGIDDETKQQLVAKIAPITFVAQTYGPELLKLILEKVMVTETTKMNSGATITTTQPKPEYLHFILNRIIEALAVAQKSVQ